MEIYVFNKGLEMLGVFDTYNSLIWRREYYKAGNFEVHLDLPGDDAEATEIISLLSKGNIVLKADNPEEAACIDTVTLEGENEEKMVVSGYFIGEFVADRIIWGTQNFVGTVEETMKYFVSNNCITPINPNRIIPNLILSANKGISIQANEMATNINLATFIEETALKHDVGWRINVDLENKKYIFDVYQGKDLSIDQTLYPQTIFSMDYENIINQTFTDSDNGYKNTAFIIGEGEGIDQKTATLNDESTGFERREMLVDAKDLKQTKEDETLLTDPEYQALLIEKGKSRIAEVQPIQTFVSGISVYSNLIYKQDFDLGDIVTNQSKRWGITLNTRITSIEEVYENNEIDIHVNFGNNIPTLIEKLKTAVK